MRAYDGHEKRRFPRYPLTVPVHYNPPGDDDGRSRLADLSEGGLSFASSMPIAPGERVEVALPLEDQRFTLTGSVVRCDHDGADSFRIGLAFSEPTVAFRRKLAEQILRIHELRRELSRLRDEEVTIEEAARDWVEHYAREFSDLYR